MYLASRACRAVTCYHNRLPRRDYQSLQQQASPVSVFQVEQMDIRFLAKDQGC